VFTGCKELAMVSAKSHLQPFLLLPTLCKASVPFSTALFVQVKSSLWAADGLHDPDIAAMNGGQ
jgi:hypothetical protein